MKDRNTNVIAISIVPPIPLHEEYFVRPIGHFVSIDDFLRGNILEKFPIYSPCEPPDEDL